MATFLKNQLSTVAYFSENITAFYIARSCDVITAEFWSLQETADWEETHKQSKTIAKHILICTNVLYFIICFYMQVFL